MAFVYNLNWTNQQINHINKTIKSLTLWNYDRQLSRALNWFNQVTLQITPTCISIGSIIIPSSSQLSKPPLSDGVSIPTLCKLFPSEQMPVHRNFLDIL
jgi:hypothetical protein